MWRSVEVGVLQFSRVYEAETQEIVIEAPLVFQENCQYPSWPLKTRVCNASQASFFKQTPAMRSQSLLAYNHTQLPFGCHMAQYNFEPEYPMEQYSRIAVG